ncbi:unnamed protein product, partial [Phaeothamnion confervicola]
MDRGEAWRSAYQEERGEALVGRRIRIWWDGDSCYYAADVIEYAPETDIYSVQYLNDTQLYAEQLDNAQWQIDDNVPQQMRGATA